ncbi:hypothetical protein A6V39_04715 [Candidatus Mycoplasma haematobovis]|uniref:Uncharacterized protein n=1 Tax=Candidatus Mycoplasma haematobovis TaxID=432608 RepID=A0A1A9QBM0_9MOLU|nr:hypothetical protein [Candidatus Mycoplasma haematobovis]OAL09853.1 hypothetical protein A6V39_04715 [Candidatus Mycoplasma haematobovis]
MLSLVKFGMPCFLGVGSAGVVGSNWIFKKEEVLLIDSEDKEDWDQKVKDLFKKIKNGDTNLKSQIAGTSEHAKSLEIEDSNNNNFKEPAKARDSLIAWCQSKRDSNEDIVTELCKEKQWTGWLFGNRMG